MKPIRFAPIPKCASRSLKQLDILGETHSHSKISEYPDWQKYDWYYVERDSEAWYKSYWIQLRINRSRWALSQGMALESFESDRAYFNKPFKSDFLPEEGVNRWMPLNSKDIFDEYLGAGRDFKDFCFETILDGKEAKCIPLGQLDEWLVKRGYDPLHENANQPFEGKTEAENADPEILALVQSLKASGKLADVIQAATGESAVFNMATHAAIKEGVNGNLWRRQIVLPRVGSSIRYDKPNYDHIAYLIRGKALLTTWKTGADGKRHEGTVKEITIAAPYSTVIKTGTYHKFTALSKDVILERLFALRDCKTGEMVENWDGSGWQHGSQP